MSRRRDWTPNGVLVSSREVKIYRRTQPEDSKPEKVIVRLVGVRGERKYPFLTKTAAKVHLEDLTKAINLGEKFDVGSFEPASWGTHKGSADDGRVRWLDFATLHADEMARAGNKTKTRTSRHEALRYVIWCLVDDAPNHPGRDAIKAFCEVWLKPVSGDPRLTPAKRAEQRANVRADRLANLPELVFARPGVKLPRAEVLAAGEWLRAHSQFVDEVKVALAQGVLNDFRYDLKGNPVADTTRNRKRNSLHKLFEAAVLAELIPANPMDRLNLRGYASAIVR